jgi:hypothetical protein
MGGFLASGYRRLVEFYKIKKLAMAGFFISAFNNCSRMSRNKDCHNQNDIL